MNDELEKMGIGDLETYMNHLEEEADQARQVYESAQKKFVETAKVFVGLVAWRYPTKELLKDRHSHIDVEKLRGLQSQRDALIVIARLTEGIVRSTEAGRLLEKAGLTEAKPSSISPATYRLLNDDEENWEWVEPGTFRLKWFEPEPGAQATSEVEVETEEATL